MSPRWKPHEYSAGAATVRFDPELRLNESLFKEAQGEGDCLRKRVESTKRVCGHMQRSCIRIGVCVIATLDP